MKSPGKKMSGGKPKAMGLNNANLQPGKGKGAGKLPMGKKYSK